MIPLSTVHNLSAFAGSMRDKIALYKFSDIYIYQLWSNIDEVLIFTDNTSKVKRWLSNIFGVLLLFESCIAHKRNTIWSSYYILVHVFFMFCIG